MRIRRQSDSCFLLDSQYGKCGQTCSSGECECPTVNDVSGVKTLMTGDRMLGETACQPIRLQPSRYFNFSIASPRRPHIQQRIITMFVTKPVNRLIEQMRVEVVLKQPSIIQNEI